MADKCSLTWKTFPEHLQFVFKDLYHDGRHTDVTLVSDDQTQFKAHKIVLSASSSVFKKIIDSNPSQHPLIYLRGIQSHEIESILQFMYLGEGRFYRERMGEFFKVARDLQVKDIDVEIELSDGLSETVATNNTTNMTDGNSMPKLDSKDEVIEEENYEEQVDARKTVHQSVSVAPETDHEEFNSSEIFRESNFKNINESHKVLEFDENNITENKEQNKAEEARDVVENEKQSDEDVDDHETAIAEDKLVYSRMFMSQTTDKAPTVEADTTAGNNYIKYPCDQCEYKAKNKHNLRHHIDYKHEGVKFPCNECDHQSTTKSSLKVHMKAMHEGVKYPCNKCEFSTGHLGNLQQHINNKHIGIKYPCDQCEYQASRKDQLKLHIIRKHDDGNRKYSCHMCEYQAYAKPALNTHIKSKHEGVKYPCDQCGKQLSHAGSLHNHVLAVHEGQKFPCDQCEHQATQLSNLKAHIKKYHSSK